jgi:hypothetical protein
MVRIFRIADCCFRAVGFHPATHTRGTMIPKITIGLLIVVLIAYIVGAKYPASWVSKIPG